MGLSLIIMPHEYHFSGFLEVRLKPVVFSVNKCNGQMSFNLLGGHELRETYRNLIKTHW